jgi:hypothetical protein
MPAAARRMRYRDGGKHLTKSLSEMTAAAMSESQTSHLGAELRRRLPNSFVLELTAKEYVEVKGDG